MTFTKSRDPRMDGKRDLIITFGRNQAATAYPTDFPPGTSLNDQAEHFRNGPHTRPIRFNGRMFKQGLATSIGRGQRYIYFYWPAKNAWYQFNAPLNIDRILTYRFSPDTEL